LTRDRITTKTHDAQPPAYSDSLLTVKELAAEFNVTPYRIRTVLRAGYRNHPLFSHWQFHGPNEARQVRAFLKSVLLSGGGGS
jgi:hypothetical protein